MAAAATDTAIQTKNVGWRRATLIYSTGELNDMIKIIKSPEGSAVLIKGVTETVEIEVLFFEIEIEVLFFEK